MIGVVRSTVSSFTIVLRRSQRSASSPATKRLGHRSTTQQRTRANTAPAVSGCIITNSAQLAATVSSGVASGKGKGDAGLADTVKQLVSVVERLGSDVVELQKANKAQAEQLVR